jgi:hypothetical protein
MTVHVMAIGAVATIAVAVAGLLMPGRARLLLLTVAGVSALFWTMPLHSALRAFSPHIAWGLLMYVVGASAAAIGGSGFIGPPRGDKG